MEKKVKEFYEAPGMPCLGTNTMAVICSAES